MTPDGQQNIIIGQASVNGVIQINVFTEIWGIVLPYISNAALTYATIGWGWTWTDSHITNYTDTGSWDSYINVSPTNYPRIPVLSCVVHSCNCDEFLHRIRLECLWRL